MGPSVGWVVGEGGCVVGNADVGRRPVVVGGLSIPLVTEDRISDSVGSKPPVVVGIGAVGLLEGVGLTDGVVLALLGGVVLGVGDG